MLTRIKSLGFKRRTQLLTLAALLTVAAAAALAGVHVRHEHLLARLLTTDTEAVVRLPRRSPNRCSPRTARAAMAPT
jgi:hypothetical protein